MPESDIKMDMLAKFLKTAKTHEFRDYSERPQQLKPEFYTRIGIMAQVFLATCSQSKK